MYLPRNLISLLYTHLLRSHHPLSPPVLILVALEPDALCASRILTSLLKRDYIPHKIQPVAGYGDLARVGEQLVQPMRTSDGGSGGVVVCLGVGGLVDLESVLGMEIREDGAGGPDGVEIWVFDARRPWNLANVFSGPSSPSHSIVADGKRETELGVDQGQITRSYRPGKGGIIVYDDGDIQEELGAEREAWCALEDMPDVGPDGDESDASDRDSADEQSRDEVVQSKKRKSWSDREDEEDDNGSEKENARPRRKRRGSSVRLDVVLVLLKLLMHDKSSASVSSTSSAHDRQARVDLRHLTPPSNQMSSENIISQKAKEPSPRQLRRRLLRLRRKYDAALRAYYLLGTSYSEPVSSLMYSLASELGREDNDLLWLAIVGVTSMELYGRTPTGVSLTNHDLPTTFRGWTGTRGARIRQTLRDEARRLNPPDPTEMQREPFRGSAMDKIPTHARSPTDTSIRLSPEPRFLLIRHWSLYDSMLHSPYLSARLHVWSDAGRRRLHKLLAKMGVSLSQCKQSYIHMDMELKKVLRDRLLHFAPVYGLEGLVPPASTGRKGDKEGWGFVRSWGWKACLSAADVAVVVGAILEVGQHSAVSQSNYRPSTHTVKPLTSSQQAEETIERFYTAYDALLSPSRLMQTIPLAQALHRAILRTGTSLLQKKQIKHLRAFRMAIVKEGPDVGLFCHPGALTKLALWVGEAVAEAEKDGAGSAFGRKSGSALVLGCIDEARDVYVVVGLGGGGGAVDLEARKARQEKRDRKAKKKKEKEERREAERKEKERQGDEEANNTEDDDESEESSSDDESESEDDDDDLSKGRRRNRFGNAFQEVIEETNARVRLDSFEHCVVEVKKEDLSAFFECLSMKAVVG